MVRYTTLRKKLVIYSNDSFNIMDWFLFIFMCGCFVFVGKSNVFNIFSVFVYLFVLGYFFLRAKLEVAIIPLLLFHQILIVNGVSFYYVYLFAFVIYFFVIKKAHIIYNDSIWFYILFLLMIMFSFGLDVVIHRVILFFVIYLLFTEHVNDDKKRNDLLKIITISAVFSGLYGLLFGAAMDFDYGIRYSGSISDPNYSALFFDIGIVAALCCIWKKSIVKYIMIALLLVCLVRTISLSGMAIMMISVFLYYLFCDLKKGMMIGFLMLLLLIFILMYSFPIDSVLWGIQYRIQNALGFINSGNYSDLTSGRTGLVEEYLELYENSGFLGKVFGFQNNIFKKYGESLIDLIGNASHNSYVDILISNGVLGLMVIGGLFLYKITYYLNKFMHNKNDKTYIGFVLLKIVVVLFVLTISIYPANYFCLFVLI